MPLVFCFDCAGDMLDAMERAVDVLHVTSSSVSRLGRGFILCVTVRLSERIAARSLFTEYGAYIGAGRCLAAYASEQTDCFIPDAVARIGNAIKKG